MCSKSIKVWDVENGQLNYKLEENDTTLSFITFTFDSFGKRLATASNDGSLKVWDLTAGQELKAIKSNGFKHLLNIFYLEPTSNEIVLIAFESDTIHFYIDDLKTNSFSLIQSLTTISIETKPEVVIMENKPVNTNKSSINKKPLTNIAEVKTPDLILKENIKEEIELKNIKSIFHFPLRNWFLIAVDDKLFIWNYTTKLVETIM
jgi:WD40 repeat protein